MKMLKSLKIIKKINKNELDKEGSKLGILKKELSTLEELKRTQEKKLKTEAKIIGDETLIYLNNFILQMRKDIKNIDSFIKVKKEELRKQELIVTEKFIEFKKIEILETNKISILKEEQKISEQKELDEIAQIIWNKRQ